MDIHEYEPEKNPFPTHIVYDNITHELKELISTEEVKVIIVPAIESVNIGRTVGYDIIEHVPPKDIKEISATKIRKKLKL
jgi:hypothetical protein